MSQTSHFAGRVLCQGSRALAAYSANELLETRPEAKNGFGPDPFSGWQSWLAGRIEELAAAVVAEQPRLFVSQVQWSKAVLAARGISPEHHRAGLKCLRNVLARELPERARPPATTCLDEALLAFDEQPADVSARLLPDTPAGRLASAYLLALLEGDRRRASRLILDGLEQSRSVPDTYLEVLLPAQQELGRMWLVNEINVAEEHFATQTTKMILAQLLPRATPQPPNGKTVLAAAVSGNQHDIGLQAVADFFEMAGWRTIALGANVPIASLVQAVECFDVDLVALSISLSTQLETAKETITAVREGARGESVKILVGGHALADPGQLPRQLGADGYAADPVMAVALGSRLVGLS
jgi:methanogenic corrinoid protein MtbC1